MTVPASSAPEAKPDRSRKTIIGWTIAMLAALLLAWFVGAVAWPIFMTIDEVYCYTSGPVNPEEWAEDVGGSIRRMGGAEEAAQRLSLYTRLPKWLAPRPDVAARMLAECKEHAFPEFLKLTEHEDEGVRAQAAIALGKSGDLSAVDALIPMLEDDSRWVCRCSAEALGILGDPRSIGPLKALERKYVADPEDPGYLYKDASHEASIALGRIQAKDRTPAP